MYHQNVTPTCQNGPIIYGLYILSILPIMIILLVLDKMGQLYNISYIIYFVAPNLPERPDKHKALQRPQVGSWPHIQGAHSHGRWKNHDFIVTFPRDLH